MPDNADQGPAYKLQIKGLIRFSYLTKDIARQTIDDPDRLLRRFALFEYLTLRSRKLPTNPAFRVDALVGEDFSCDAAHLLATFLADVPQAKINRWPGMVDYRAIRIAFEMMGDDPEVTHTATLRRDGDAIHKDWMAQITPRRAAQNIYLRNRRKLAEICGRFNSVNELMFLRPVHRGNNLCAKSSGHQEKMKAAQIKEHLLDGFGLRFDELRQTHVS